MTDLKKGDLVKFVDTSDEVWVCLSPGDLGVVVSAPRSSKNMLRTRNSSTVFYTKVHFFKISKAFFMTDNEIEMVNSSNLGNHTVLKA